MRTWQKILVGDDRAVLRQLEDICRIKGFRLTGQRRLVAQILLTSTDHPDVNTLLERAKEVDPAISMPTLYRTVKFFEECNLVSKLDLEDGRARYELCFNTKHDHFVDIETGDIIEFCDPDLEALKVKVAQKLGFELTGHKLILYGKKK